MISDHRNNLQASDKWVAPTLAVVVAENAPLVENGAKFA
jgi:hypothetical protein